MTSLFTGRTFFAIDIELIIQEMTLINYDFRKKKKQE